MGDGISVCVLNFNPEVTAFSILVAMRRNFFKLSSDHTLVMRSKGQVT